MKSTPLRLRRAERRVEMLEALVEARNRELTVTQEQAQAVQTYLLGLNDIMPGALMCVTPEGELTRVNQGLHALLGYQSHELFGTPVSRLWPGAPAVIRRCLEQGAEPQRGESEWLAQDGVSLPVLWSAVAQRDADGSALAVIIMGQDLSEQRRLELELRHAQKLESLGQLAAGIAHEINTPIQFVGDNMHFVRDAFQALQPLLELIGQLPVELRSLQREDLAARIETAQNDSDFEFSRTRVPRAVTRALEGIERVNHIVAAMKAFADPHGNAGPTDLNQGLRDTLTIAHNEYKYVAEVETELGELPPVICNAGDINQVILNLIVNAAHAIEPTLTPARSKGLIRIRTYTEDSMAVIAVSDDGTGIPEAIRHRVFDPFFTTKEVGKGTGQGLAISRSIVVEHHGGTLSFTTEPGHGTTFFVRIPIKGSAHMEAA